VPHPTTRLEKQLSYALRGKHEQVRLAIVCLLAEGHLLIEDVPGLGKTTLARALATSITGSCSRIQFTPDLMPSDITGVSVYNQASSSFEFHPGPVFSNVVVADEINRASPRTQSALLEVMAEHTVSYDGASHPVPRPFMVVATQNPVDMDGTYPLPEAQLDRFLLKISLGYPDHATEVEIVRTEQGEPTVSTLSPILTTADVESLTQGAKDVYASDAVVDFAVRLIETTRSHPDVHVGCSPRASIGLVKCAKAHAFLEGRDHVLPSDVSRLAVAIMAHRLVLKSAAGDPVGIVNDILSRTPVPPGDMRP
jgi:MoxR-like ATPase